MSEAAKAEIARIDAEVVCIEAILKSCREAANELRRTLHLPHLHFPAGVMEMMHSVECTRDGLLARRRKIEIFIDRPAFWANVIPIKKES